MNGVLCRFFGGPMADMVVEFDAQEILRHGVVECPARDGNWFEDVNSPTVTYSRHVYRWDNTINERGEHRMRWYPPTGWQPPEDYHHPYAERLLRELGLT